MKCGKWVNLMMTRSQHRNTAVAEEVNESQANSTILTKTVMFKLNLEEQTWGLQNSFALI